MRQVYGPPQRNAAPIRNLQGELLTDNEAINKRWPEHFKQLLNRPSSTDPNVIEEIPTRPLQIEIDDPPTEDEVREAVDELQCGNSAGSDGIPPEVPLIQTFTEFLCSCWEDGCLPPNLKVARIVHLSEGKGDKSNCDNSRGITFLSIAGKILSNVILNRLNGHRLDDTTELVCISQ